MQYLKYTSIDRERQFEKTYGLNCMFLSLFSAQLFTSSPSRAFVFSQILFIVQLKDIRNSREHFFCHIHTHRSSVDDENDDDNKRDGRKRGNNNKNKKLHIDWMHTHRLDGKWNTERQRNRNNKSVNDAIILNTMIDGCFFLLSMLYLSRSFI